MDATAFSSRLVAFVCGMTALLSGLVLLGWVLDYPFLTAFVADWPPTPVPTAFLLLLSSAALWLLRKPRLAPLAAVMAAMVLLLGVLGLAETWLSFSSGIQEGVAQLFLTEPAHAAARMLPHAILAFTLLGVALLILANDGRNRSYFAQGFALAVVVLALQTVMSLAQHTMMSSPPDGGAGMAFPAALGFLLLGTGTLFVRPTQGLAAILLSKGPGGALLRFIVPVVLIVPNGLILLAMEGLRINRYADGFMVVVLALVWVAAVLAMFFALGLYLNRKSEVLIESERRYRTTAHELRLTNQLMERIFSNIHVLVAYLDADFNFIRVNENYAAADGQRPPDFFVGKNHFALYPDKENEAVFRRVLESGEPYVAHAKPFEYPDQPERGVTYWDWNLTPVNGEGGKVEGLLLTLADVTERVQLRALDTLFNEIDQQVLRGLPLPGLLEFICVEVARLLEYPLVWIGRKEAGGEISIAACAGPAESYRVELEKGGVRWDDTPQGHGPTGLTIRLGQAQVFSCSDAALKPWWCEAAERSGLKAVTGIPLIIRGEVYGAFTLYSYHEHGFNDTATVQRLGMIAGRICVALEKAMDQQQLRLLGTALASAGNGVFITDRRGRIQWLNQSFTRLTGYSAQDAMGETPRIIKSGKQGADYYHKLWQTITQGEVWSSETIEKHKDGSEFTVQQTITPIRDTGGEVTHFISILEDITAQKATEAHMQHMAHYDALTDLPNRALFYDRLQQVLAQARRGHYPAALMFLDLDRFKTVNDTLGHHIGDLLLQETAKRIRACVRESDTVARLGGDEFTVLLPQVTGRESAAVVASKILAVFAEPFMLDGHELRTSTSIGISLYPQDTIDCDKLVKFADSAMYEAKQRGRGYYYFFDASSESL
jgi:diguanylate cyclase (GGDEF)-like protein/PAS domain S-box-containing protein